MRLIAVTASSLIGLTAALLTPSLAHADGRSFAVVNQNDSVSVQQVWTAAASTKEVWKEADLDSPIPSGRSMTFTMPPGATCFMDVKIRFSDGYEASFANVNVCRADRVIAR